MALKCSVCDKTLERGTAHDHNRDGRPDARHWNPHPPSGWNEHGYEDDAYSPPQPSPTPSAGPDESESPLDEEEDDYVPSRSQADTPLTQGHSPPHDTSGAGSDPASSTPTSTTLEQLSPEVGADETWYSTPSGFAAPGSVQQGLTPEQQILIAQAESVIPWPHRLHGPKAPYKNWQSEETYDESDYFVWAPAAFNAEGQPDTAALGAFSDPARFGGESEIFDMGVNPSLVAAAHRRRIDLEEERRQLGLQYSPLARAGEGESWVPRGGVNPSLVRQWNARQLDRQQFLSEYSRLGELGMIHPDDPRAELGIRYRSVETLDPMASDWTSELGWSIPGRYSEYLDPMASDWTNEIGYTIPRSKEELGMMGAYMEPGRAVDKDRDPGYWGEAITWKRRLDSARHLVEKYPGNTRLWLAYLDVVADAPAAVISIPGYGLREDAVRPLLERFYPHDPDAMARAEQYAKWRVEGDPRGDLDPRLDIPSVFGGMGDLTSVDLYQRRADDFSMGYTVGLGFGHGGGIMSGLVGALSVPMASLLWESVTDPAVPIEQRAHLGAESVIEVIAEMPGMKYPGAIEDLADVIAQGKNWRKILDEIKSPEGLHASHQVGAASMGASAAIMVAALAARRGVPFMSINLPSWVNSPDAEYTLLDNLHRQYMKENAGAHPPVQLFNQWQTEIRQNLEKQRTPVWQSNLQLADVTEGSRLTQVRTPTGQVIYVTGESRGGSPTLVEGAPQIDWGGDFTNFDWDVILKAVQRDVWLENLIDAPVLDLSNPANVRAWAQQSREERALEAQSESEASKGQSIDAWTPPTGVSYETQFERWRAELREIERLQALATARADAEIVAKLQAAANARRQWIAQLQAARAREAQEDAAARTDESQDDWPSFELSPVTQSQARTQTEAQADVGADEQLQTIKTPIAETERVRQRQQALIEQATRAQQAARIQAAQREAQERAEWQQAAQREAHLQAQLQQQVQGFAQLQQQTALAQQAAAQEHVALAPSQTPPTVEPATTTQTVPLSEPFRLVPTVPQTVPPGTQPGPTIGVPPGIEQEYESIIPETAPDLELGPITVGTPTEQTQQQRQRRTRPRLPKSPIDEEEKARQDRERGPGYPRVVVRRDLVERAIDLETGHEEIVTVAAGDLKIARTSARPHRNRKFQSGNRLISTDQTGRVSEKRNQRRRRRHPFFDRRDAPMRRRTR